MAGSATFRSGPPLRSNFGGLSVRLCAPSVNRIFARSASKL